MLGDKNAYILNKLCQNFIFFDDVFWELAPRTTGFVVDRTADLTAEEGEPGQSRGALLRTQCGSGLRRWASKEHNQILQKTGASLNDPRQVGAASTKSAHCYREEKRPGKERAAVLGNRRGRGMASRGENQTTNVARRQAGITTPRFCESNQGRRHHSAEGPRKEIKRAAREARSLNSHKWMGIRGEG